MSTPLLLIAIVGVVVIVGVTVMFYLKARHREAVDAPGLRNVASAAAPVAVAEEVRAIGEQIDRAMLEQRIQGETQRQLLAQKLDSVRQTIDHQRTHVDGLRSEMRHESNRRDMEMDEIRAQIGTLHQAVGLPAAAQAALPPALSSAAPSATEPAPDTPSPAIPSPALEREHEPEASLSSLAPPAPLPAALPTLESFSTPEPVVVPEAVDVPETTALPEPTSAPDPVSAPASEPQERAPETFDVSDGQAWSPAEATSPTVPQPLSFGTFEDVDFGEAALVGPVTPEPAAPRPPELEDVAFALPQPSDDSPAAEPEADGPEESASADPFGEISFDDEAPEAPSGDSTFVELSFDAPPTEPASPFDQSDSGAPVGGDSFATKPSMFESWAPIIPAASGAPAAPAAPAATDEKPAAALDGSSSSEQEVFAPAPPDQLDATPEPAPVPRPDAALQTIDASEFASVAVAAAPDGLVAPEPLSVTAPDAQATPSAWISRPDRAPDTAAPAALADELIDPNPLAVAPAATPASMAAVPQPAAAAPEVPRAAAEAATAEDAPERYQAPEGAETLTVISSIDEGTQRLLYQEGVTSLEEIAQWGRGDARRIGVAVQVSEDTIMNAWVFEAQAALFSRYAQEAGS